MVGSPGINSIENDITVFMGGVNNGTRTYILLAWVIVVLFADIYKILNKQAWLVSVIRRVGMLIQT